MNREHSYKNIFGYQAKQTPNLPLLPTDCIHKNKYLSSNQRCTGNSEMCEQKCLRVGHVSDDHKIIEKDEFTIAIKLKKEKQIEITQKLLQKLKKAYYDEIKPKIYAVLDAIYMQTVEKIKYLTFQDQVVKLIGYVENNKFNPLSCSHIHYLNSILTQRTSSQIKGEEIINKFRNISVSIEQKDNSKNNQNISKLFAQARKQFEGKFNEQKKNMLLKQKRLQDELERFKKVHEKQEKKAEINTQMDQEHSQKTTSKFSYLNHQKELQDKKIKLNINNSVANSSNSHSQPYIIQGNKNNSFGASPPATENQQKNRSVHKKLVDMSLEQMSEIKQKIAAKRARRDQEKASQNQLEKDKVEQKQKAQKQITSNAKLEKKDLETKEMDNIKNVKIQVVNPSSDRFAPMETVIKSSLQAVGKKEISDVVEVKKILKNESNDDDFGLYDPEQYQLVFKDKQQEQEYVPHIKDNNVQFEQFQFKQFKNTKS